MSEPVPPPFDPELAAALAAVSDTVWPSLRPDQIAAKRAVPRLPAGEFTLGGVFTAEDLVVPGPEGAPDISLLVCRPVSAREPTGALYFIHGGGMVMGDNRAGVPDMLELAAELGMAVVSVEYRLAPENPHPAPVEDCYAGLLWTFENAVEIGVDPARVVVGGSSAGGGLAAALALMARDRGGPVLLGQLLLCPMLDDHNDTFSGFQMVGLGTWDRIANDTGWNALLGEARGGPDVSPYAAPARAEDLSGLPPAFIDVGSAETFRDEDVAYATRIWQAGGRAELHVWPGGFHGFDLLSPRAALSRDSREARVRWMRRLLA